MVCIYCGDSSTEVTNSRSQKRRPAVWRRRRCTRCKQTFTTDEQPRIIATITSGSQPDAKEPLSISRLTISIWKSFQHNPTQGSLVAGDLAQTAALLIAPEHSITTKELSEIIYQTVKRYDPSAGLTYALQHHLLTSLKSRGRPSFASPDASQNEPSLAKPVSPYRSHQTYRDTFRAPDESAH